MWLPLYPGLRSACPGLRDTTPCMLVPMSTRSPSSSPSGLWEMWETRSLRSVFQAAVEIAQRFPRACGRPVGRSPSLRGTFPSVAAGLPQARQTRHFPQAARVELSLGAKIPFRPANRSHICAVEQVTSLLPGRPTTPEAFELVPKIGPPDLPRQCRRVSETKSLHYKVGRRGLCGSGFPTRRPVPSTTSPDNPGRIPGMEEHTQRKEGAYGDFCRN